MKVKCVALLNSDGKPVDFSPWLTLGKVYQVLSVFRDSSGKERFRILSNERDEDIASLGLHLESCFEVVSEFRPSNWCDRALKGGAVEIAPKAWQSEGFWEALYDGDPKAYQAFDRERQLILREEPD
jgi:hypothetical protein